MATKLLKPVVRELTYTDRGKTWVVTLEPGDVISFRQKGKRTSYSVSLHNVSLLALMGHLREKHNEKVDEYRIKKKAGYTRLRKPKPLSYSMFNRFYQKVMEHKRVD